MVSIRKRREALEGGGLVACGAVVDVPSAPHTTWFQDRRRMVERCFPAAPLLPIQTVRIGSPDGLQIRIYLVGVVPAVRQLTILKGPDAVPEVTKDVSVVLSQSMFLEAPHLLSKDGGSGRWTQMYPAKEFFCTPDFVLP